MEIGVDRQCGTVGTVSCRTSRRLPVALEMGTLWGVSDLELVEAIVDDINEHKRSFLPGGNRPTMDMLQSAMNGNVQFGGLDEEATKLLLSCLPEGADRLSVVPLDKGLSGAAVVSGRYRLGTKRSKPFVFKVGPLEKIEREADAIARWATPFLRAIGAPVIRRGGARGLIAQELHGLSATGSTVSLREFVRDDQRGVAVIGDLLHERLFPWYEQSTGRSEHRIREVCRWWLTKAPRDLSAVVPCSWSQLPAWAEAVSGAPPIREEALTALLESSIISSTSVIHGDLHTQNILVDPKSCDTWPIDFGWCADGYPPVLDAAMLECSLKFLAIPMRADLRTLLEVEAALVQEATPDLSVEGTPFCEEVARCFAAVREVRRFALDGPCPVTFEDYKRVLAALTLSLSNHQGLNQPIVLGSLQMLVAEWQL